MIKLIAITSACLLFVTGFCQAQNLYEDIYSGRHVIRLDSGAATVAVDLGGGGIVDFRRNGSGLNPFTWNYRKPGDIAPERLGHFVCFDRLGRSSTEEIKNGMPGHGEAPYVLWRLLSTPEHIPGAVTVSVQCDLPLGGMRLARRLELSDNAPVIRITDEITNLNKLGRLYNIVQHPTIAAPFLDRTVLLDTNAVKGFYAKNPMPMIEEPLVYWPKQVFEGALVDLRRFTDVPSPVVTNFAFDPGEVYGWVTACNPEKGLMLGYFWELEDYPWCRIWKTFVDGLPTECGLEFGTTPLPLPFKDIVAKGDIFGLPVIEYMDAGESRTKSFTCFLAEIPAYYPGVADIELDNGVLKITARGEQTGNITVTCPPMFVPVPE